MMLVGIALVLELWLCICWQLSSAVLSWGDNLQAWRCWMIMVSFTAVLVVFVVIALVLLK